MLFRLAAPVTNLLKTRGSQPTSEQGVPELLAALAEVRAKKAQLEQEEKDIIATTRERLRQQQEFLEELRKKVNGCGIEVHQDVLAPSSAATEEAPRGPSQTVELTN